MSSLYLKRAQAMWHRLKKHLPKSDSLRQEGPLHWFGERLQHVELWQFQRPSVSKAIAFGLFSAFIPLPGQTVVAALLAYLGRANLPIALAMTWITNPITFLPINYGIYKIGQWLTGDSTPYHPLSALHWHDADLMDIVVHLGHWLGSMGKPFLLGSFVVAIASAIAGYILVQGIWRLTAIWQREPL